MPTLFISDLHLCGKRPAVTEGFLKFLSHQAIEADALYILGDFFEYWIGDEAIDHPDHRPVIDGLKRLTSGGTPVFLQHGNRDFLLGEAFARASGCTLLPDPYVLDLYGTPTLLTHGDYLCTDDSEYQTFRQMVRDPQWQQTFLSQSVEEREAVARHYRQMSMEISATKKPEIMDVSDATVRQQMKQHAVQQMIHGHTHRPAIHEFELGGHPAKRIVLGDWYDQGSVLVVDAQRIELADIDMDHPERMVAQ